MTYEGLGKLAADKESFTNLIDYNQFFISADNLKDVEQDPKSFPYEINLLDKDVNAELLKYFKGKNIIFINLNQPPNN